MRTTYHNGRTHRNGKTYSKKHNDRNFETQTEHIDPTKTHLNILWTWNNAATIEEAEEAIYENFREQWKETNEKYKKNRHPDRCKPFKDWCKQRIHAPEETIQQIGKMEEHTDTKTLLDCLYEYFKFMNKWNNEHGKPFKLLNFAVHFDEKGAPHCHYRKLWIYFNKDKNHYEIGQEKALQQAGINPPYPDLPISNRNNRKITFDKIMREKWQEIAISHGLEIELEKLPENEVGKPLDQFIKEKEAKRAAAEKALEKEKQEFETQKKTDLEEIANSKADLQAEKENFSQEKQAFNDDMESQKAGLEKEKQEFETQKKTDLEEIENSKADLQTEKAAFEIQKEKDLEAVETKKQEAAAELNKQADKINTYRQEGIDEHNAAKEEKKEILEIKKSVDQNISIISQWEEAAAVMTESENYIDTQAQEIRDKKINFTTFLTNIKQHFRNIITKTKKLYDARINNYEKALNGYDTLKNGREVHVFGQKELVEAFTTASPEELETLAKEIRESGSKNMQEAYKKKPNILERCFEYIRSRTRSRTR